MPLVCSVWPWHVGAGAWSHDDHEPSPTVRQLLPVTCVEAFERETVKSCACVGRTPTSPAPPCSCFSWHLCAVLVCDTCFVIAGGLPAQPDRAPDPGRRPERPGISQALTPLPTAPASSSILPTSHHSPSLGLGTSRYLHQQPACETASNGSETASNSPITGGPAVACFKAIPGCHVHSLPVQENLSPLPSSLRVKIRLIIKTN